MSPRLHLPLEGQPATTSPHAAEPAPPRPVVGAQRDVARRASASSVRFGRHNYDDGRRPVAWLHIGAPRGAVPTATSKCLCGRDRSAVGHRRVLALIDDHTAHLDRCPLCAPREGRTAA
ncbi:hypothetical protein N4G70_16690 [Streptomyces sp. ASQP_92]|uniref:hypothetical protein n=1 Tax=Streptomyces sp. ASQP_92 TaxID=2979116 RepID=UPI0021BF6257|nr:hypothetical protein [Streptomyces sp. ASQP_92]MCT9090489.1 hypothetical protein [Streptomyces sp. ASQP_92]